MEECDRFSSMIDELKVEEGAKLPLLELEFITGSAKGHKISLNGEAKVIVGKDQNICTYIIDPADLFEVHQSEETKDGFNHHQLHDHHFEIDFKSGYPILKSLYPDYRQSFGVFKRLF